MAAEKTTDQTWKVVRTTEKLKPAHQPTKPAPAEPERVTVRVTKALTDYSPRAIRDSINQKLGSTVVAKVAISQKENFVITLLPNYRAIEFIEQRPRWESAFEAYGIQGAEQPSTWIKLLAHGVPTRDFDLNQFKAEVETFNPSIRVKGSPRWLNKPSEEKRAGSVVFSVATEAEKRAAVGNGLIIAGITVKVEAMKFFTATTQCFRCQGFNHNPQTCTNKYKCRLCAGNHPTRHHKCSTCSASGTYSHLRAKCSNYSGPHTANHTECEVYRAIKARKPTTGSTEGPVASHVTDRTMDRTTGPLTDFTGDVVMEINPQPTGLRDPQTHDQW